MTYIPFDPKNHSSGTIQNHFDDFFTRIHEGKPPPVSSVQYIETRRAFFAGIWFHRNWMYQLADDPAMTHPETSEPTELCNLVNKRREKEMQGFYTGIGEGGR